MADNEINLTQYVFKKVKFFNEKPDLFIQVCKLALERLGKLDKAPDNDWFLEKLKDKDNQYLPVDTIIRNAQGYVSRIEYESELQELQGYFLPTHDLVVGIEKFMNTEIKGIHLPFIKLDGELISITLWKSGGQTSLFLQLDADFKLAYKDRRRVPIPVFYRSKIKVFRSITPSKVDPKIQYTNYKFETLISIDPDQIIPADLLQQVLIANSKLPKDITIADKGSVLILRDIKWKNSQGAELWKASDKQIKIIPADPSQIKKDGKGNPIYEYKQAPPEQDPIGQGLIQIKNGTEETPIDIPTFKLMLSSRSLPNAFINANLWNNQFGNPLVWMPSFNYIIDNASKTFGNLKSNEPKKDPFGYIDGVFKGSDLIIIGKLTNVYRPKTAPDTDPLNLTFSIFFMANLLFPFTDSEDRELPVNIKNFDQTFPIYHTLGNHTDLKIGEIPKDVDLNLGMNASELAHIDQEFKKLPEQKVLAEAVESFKPDSPTQEELEFGDEFGKWLDTLTSFWNSKDYVYEDDFITKYNVDLLDLLEDTGDVWRPSSPSDLYISNKSGKIEPNGDLYHYFMELHKDSEGGVNFKELIKKEEIMKKTLTDDINAVKSLIIPKKATHEELDEVAHKVMDKISNEPTYNDPNGICAACQTKRVVSSQTGYCQQCDTAETHGLRWNIEQKKYVPFAIAIEKQIGDDEFKSFIEIQKSIFELFDNNYVTDLMGLEKSYSNYLIKNKLGSVVPSPEGSLWLKLDIPMDEFELELKNYWVELKKKSPVTPEKLIKSVDSASVHLLNTIPSDASIKDIEKGLDDGSLKLEPSLIKHKDGKVEIKSLGVVKAPDLKQSGFETHKYSTDQLNFLEEMRSWWKSLSEELDDGYVGHRNRYLTPNFIAKLIDLEVCKLINNDTFLVQLEIDSDNLDNVTISIKDYYMSNMSKGSIHFFTDDAAKKMSEIREPKEMIKQQLNKKIEKDKTKKDYLDNYKNSTTEIDYTYDGLNAKPRHVLNDIAKEMNITRYTKGKKDNLIQKILDEHAIKIAPLSNKDITEEDVTDYTKLETVMQPQGHVNALKNNEIKFEKAFATNEPIVTHGLTDQQKIDLEDLELSIEEYMKSGSINDTNFNTLFNNFRAFLPEWIDETYGPLVDKVIDKVKMKLAGEEM